MSEKFEIIGTLNEHLLRKEMLQPLVEKGVTILRVNGSHLPPAEIGRYATEARKHVGRNARLLVDLPGNKIRTAVLSQPILLKAGDTFELRPSQVNYPGFVSRLSKGDEILANDSRFRFRVEEAGQEKAVLYSFNDGELISNKGMHLIGKDLDLPFLFERDRELIRNAVANDFEYIGLSFVRKPSDIQDARDFVKSVLPAGKAAPKFIVKVETSGALANLDAILDMENEFLVDRGDLSCDIGIENIDLKQKWVLRKALQKNKKIYFATQFFFSMVNSNVPLIAEVCGFSDAVASGVSGIQLSEETAIGKHPLEILRVMDNVLKAARPRENSKLKPVHGAAPVFWFTGLSGSGKSTIANAVKQWLEQRGARGILIDGDEFRGFDGGSAGYSKEERMKNQRNIAFTAVQAAKASGVDFVIVSSLSPYREMRGLARSALGAAFHEIYVKCAPAVCAARDPKGLYKKTDGSQRGHEDLAALAASYEAPEKPELTLDTEKNSVAQCLESFGGYVS